MSSPGWEFTDLERKGNIHLIYARYCLQVRREDEGVRLLEQLRAELEDELRRNAAPMYRQLLQTTLDVLGQLGG